MVQNGSQVVGSERERRGQRQQPWFRKGPKSWGVREKEEDKDNSLGSERVPSRGECEREKQTNSLGSERVPSRGECEREKRTKTTALVQKGSQVVGSARERRGQRQQPWFRKGPKSWGVREREEDKDNSLGSERVPSRGECEREKQTNSLGSERVPSRGECEREKQTNSLGSERVPSRGECEREKQTNSLGSERVPSRGECEREKQTHATALVQKGSQVAGSARERSRHTQQPWFRKGPKSWGEREREADKQPQPWFRKGPKSWGVREREADKQPWFRKRSRQTALVQKGSQVVGNEREREEDTHNSLGSERVPSRGECEREKQTHAVRAV